MTKVLKRSAQFAEMMTDGDNEENVRVLRAAKRATHRIYDPQTKTLIEVPDHKTRLAAVALELAYTEGLPVARATTLRVAETSIGETLSLIRSSPAAMEMLREIESLPQTPTIDVQETA